MSPARSFFTHNAQGLVNDTYRRLLVASYLTAFLFVLAPVVDILANVWPWDFGNEQWRFGLAGVTSNYLISLIFGLLMAAWIAGLREHRGMLFAVAGVSALVLLLLGVLTLLFVLDTIQVRTVVREEQLQLFKIGAVKTLFKVLASEAALLVLAVAAFKAAAGIEKPVKGGAAPLVREA